jgi:hypothetical protein
MDHTTVEPPAPTTWEGLGAVAVAGPAAETALTCPDAILRILTVPQR